jgi:hypothetical protein
MLNTLDTLVMFVPQSEAIRARRVQKSLWANRELQWVSTIIPFCPVPATADLLRLCTSYVRASYLPGLSRTGLSWWLAHAIRKWTRGQNNDGLMRPCPSTSVPRCNRYNTEDSACNEWSRRRAKNSDTTMAGLREEPPTSTSQVASISQTRTSNALTTQRPLLNHKRSKIGEK